MPGLSAPRSKIFRNLRSGCVSFTRSSDVHLVPTWKKPRTSIRLLQSGTLLFLLFNITETHSFSKQYCKLFSDPGILYMHKHWLTIQLVWQAIELQIPTWRPSISKRELRSCSAFRAVLNTPVHNFEQSMTAGNPDHKCASLCTKPCLWLEKQTPLSHHSHQLKHNPFEVCKTKP
jgi:hypothetical protein